MKEYVFDPIINTPLSFPLFTSEFFAFASVGIVLGGGIDALFIRFRKYWERKNQEKGNVVRIHPTVLLISISLLQLLVSSAILYIIFRTTSRTRFSLHWQKTVQGMAFPSFFFGIQSNLFTTFQGLYMK